MVEEALHEIKYQLYSFGKPCKKLCIVEPLYPWMDNKIDAPVACMCVTPQNGIQMVNHGIPIIAAGQELS